MNPTSTLGYLLVLVHRLIFHYFYRWDSLGEYLATAIGFQELGTRANDPKSTLLGDTLMDAVGKWLDSNKAPGRYDLRTEKEPFIWKCYFYQPRRI